MQSYKKPNKTIKEPPHLPILASLSGFQVLKTEYRDAQKLKRLPIFRIITYIRLPFQSQNKHVRSIKTTKDNSKLRLLRLKSFKKVIDISYIFKSRKFCSFRQLYFTSISNSFGMFDIYNIFFLIQGSRHYCSKVKFCFTNPD